MSKELLQRVIDEGVEYNLNSFFYAVSNDYSEIQDDLSEYDKDGFANFQAIGEIVFSANEKLVVVTAEVGEDLTERSGKKAQYEKAKKILKGYMKYDAGIFVFSDPEGSFRLSLVYGQAEGIRKSWSNFRRFTYFVSRDQVNNTFRGRVGGCDFSSLDLIRDAFSVEKVNKEFYKEIAKYYYRLTGKNGYKRELVLPSVAEDDYKKYEEYAVRLIGRIIFCWFLKHKKSASGIPLIPKEALSVSAVQNHADYYHSILEPLFFEVMNKPVKDRKPITIPQSDKIPFLNGGLFEQHGNDYYQNMPNPALKIPNRIFEDFLGVLEQYNFTIDENSIVDADVSVDPEMLGRIFENLLAEVVPETGETARKATGSYYTPRVIVDYMVEQSLKQYLLTKTALPEDKLNRLLSYEDDSIDLADSERNPVVKALKEIKVIDPACGSGAFPMSILHRMLLILEKVDPKLESWRNQYLNSLDGMVRQTVEKNIHRENWVYIRKLMIIRDSIYGVDIQPVAVEIAKLRCFLSLVVDEIVLDNEENRGIEPLPNLEFKFVAANTLIGLPSVASQSAFGITDTVSKLKELREAYLRSFGAEKIQVEKEFRDTQQKLFKESVEWALTDIQVKQLTEWDPFSYESCRWFAPEWMFGIGDGFDVVIANPPYIRISGLNEELDKDIRRGYTTVYGNYDIYVPFIELGIKLLRSDGLLAYITPNKFLTKKYANRLRPFMLDNGVFLNLVDTSQARTFDSSSVYPIVFVYIKSRLRNRKVETKIVTDANFESFFGSRIKTYDYILDHETFRSNENSMIDIFVNPGTRILINHISAGCSSLGSYSRLRTGTPAIDKFYEWAAFSKEEDKLTPRERRLALRFINVSNVGEYVIKWGQTVRAFKKRVSRPYLVYDDVIGKNKWSVFQKRKIVIKGTALRLVAAYDDIGYANLSLYAVLFDEDHDDPEKTFFHLGLINSKLLNFWYCKKFATSNISGNYITFNAVYLAQLPIKDCSHSDKKGIIQSVREILSITKDSDYPSNPSEQAKVKELECEIDQMVYELYGLTPQEIAMVEGSSASK